MYIDFPGNKPEDAVINYCKKYKGLLVTNRKFQVQVRNHGVFDLMTFVNQYGNTMFKII